MLIAVERGRHDFVELVQGIDQVFVVIDVLQVLVIEQALLLLDGLPDGIGLLKPLGYVEEPLFLRDVVRELKDE